MSNESTTEVRQYRCPKHLHVALWGVLRGGAGFCRSCNLYVQAAGIPELARIIPRPEPQKSKAKKKPAKASKRATNKRASKQRKKVTAPPRAIRNYQLERHTLN